jgi:hypothetical protein
MRISPDGIRRFERSPRMRQVDVEALLVDSIGRIDRQLERHLGGEDDDRDRLAERDPALAALRKAAILGHHASEREPDMRLAIPGPPEACPERSRRNLYPAKPIPGDEGDGWGTGSDEWAA